MSDSGSGIGDNGNPDDAVYVTIGNNQYDINAMLDPNTLADLFASNDPMAYLALLFFQLDQRLRKLEGGPIQPATNFIPYMASLLNNVLSI